MASFWSHFFISPLSSVLTTSIYVHVTGLALNRFHAVFLPFSYQKIWKKRNIKFIISVLWLIILLWSAVIYLGYTFQIPQNNFLSIFIYGVFMIGDLPLLTSLCLSAPIYIAVLSKFIYDYKTGKMQSLEDNTKKERIKILAVCLVSLIPCPWYICMYKLNVIIDANVQDTTTSIIVSVLFNTSLTILQCIEEICLVIISEDFRLVVKSQFIKNNTATNVSTNVIIVKQKLPTRNNENIK